MEHVTVLSPDNTAPPATAGVSSGFPTDLQGQSARRLRIVALTYAVVFFMAGVLPALLFTPDRAEFLSSFIRWGPAAIGISVALAVALSIQYGRVSMTTAMNLGLVFEVASSYAIAAAEFADPQMVEMHHGFMGLSWVAVWVVLFTVVVPTSPRRAVLAALMSVTSVAVVVTIVMLTATTVRLDPTRFFFALVFPYLLVVGMAYVGARVVYQLGTEVKRARELGSYQLEEKLGEGGMGEVWRARHRMLARPAAIKLMRPNLTGQASLEASQRFKREAEVTARLRSPHTVNLFDFGIATDGAFYYAMELLDGVDAEALIKRFGSMPYERVIHTIRQVCHSLSEAHSLGLVHRDIKPANIFLCRYGEEFDFVKVLDFGIVSAVRDAVETRTIQTTEHAIRGTPAFMAPEQAMGVEIDARADIYATGCLAYWLLTGKHVFMSDSPMGLLVQHAQATPPPPSGRTDRPIPRTLDHLVMSCLAKDPAQRPQSARELSQQLGAIEGGQTWTPARAREWWQANDVANGRRMA